MEPSANSVPKPGSGEDGCHHAKELENAGQYEYALSLSMLKNFMKACGKDQPNLFHHNLTILQNELNAVIKKVGYLLKDKAHDHLVEQGLTVDNICMKVKKEYRAALDEGLWPQATHATNSKAVPCNYRLNNLTLTLAELNALIQMAYDKSTSSGTKPGVCHECGKPGHWKHDCPDLNKNKMSVLVVAITTGAKAQKRTYK